MALLPKIGSAIGSSVLKTGKAVARAPVSAVKGAANIATGRPQSRAGRVTSAALATGIRAAAYIPRKWVAGHLHDAGLHGTASIVEPGLYSYHNRNRGIFRHRSRRGEAIRAARRGSVSRRTRTNSNRTPSTGTSISGATRIVAAINITNTLLGDVISTLGNILSSISDLKKVGDEIQWNMAGVQSAIKSTGEATATATEGVTKQNAALASQIKIGNDNIVKNLVGISNTIDKGRDDNSSSAVLGEIKNSRQKNTPANVNEKKEGGFDMSTLLLGLFALGGPISAAITGLVGAITAGIGAAIALAATTMLVPVKKVFDEVLEGIGKVVKNLWTSVEEGFSKAMENIKNGAKNLLDDAAKGLKNAWEGLASVGERIGKAVSGIADDIARGISAGLKTMVGPVPPKAPPAPDVPITENQRKAAEIKKEGGRFTGQKIDGYEYDPRSQPKVMPTEGNTPSTMGKFLGFAGRNAMRFGGWALAGGAEAYEYHQYKAYLEEEVKKGNISSKDAEKMLNDRFNKAMARTGGTIAGMEAGAAMGAIGGSAFGPVGTVIGGLGGGIVGGFAGSALGEQVYTTGKKWADDSFGPEDGSEKTIHGLTGNVIRFKPDMRNRTNRVIDNGEQMKSPPTIIPIPVPQPAPATPQMQMPPVAQGGSRGSAPGSATMGFDILTTKLFATGFDPIPGG